jgi:hypothetical protein
VGMFATKMNGIMRVLLSPIPSQYRAVNMHQEASVAPLTRLSTATGAQVCFWFSWWLKRRLSPQVVVYVEFVEVNHCLELKLAFSVVVKCSFDLNVPVSSIDIFE